MRRRPGYTAQVERRISIIHREVNYDTQQLRKRTMEQLEALFTMASSIAKGCIEAQRIDKKEEPIPVQQRQMWAHVAAHVALAMGHIAKGFDERQFNQDLAELEKLVDEIDNDQTQRNGKEVQGKEGKTEGIGTGSESVGNS